MCFGDSLWIRARSPPPAGSSDALLSHFGFPSGERCWATMTQSLGLYQPVLLSTADGLDAVASFAAHCGLMQAVTGVGATKMSIQSMTSINDSPAKESRARVREAIRVVFTAGSLGGI